VWAHAEYVKLRRSLRDGRVFDMPSQTVQRYVVEQTESCHTIWSSNHKCQTIAAGHTLRLQALAPAVVHWSLDGWQTVHDTQTRDTGLGVYVADLPTEGLAARAKVVFTFYWPQADRWEGADFVVQVV